MTKHLTLWKASMGGVMLPRYFNSQTEAWEWLKQVNSWTDCDHVNTYHHTRAELIEQGCKVHKFKLVEIDGGERAVPVQQPTLPGQHITVGTGDWQIRDLTTKQWSECLKALIAMEAEEHGKKDEQHAKRVKVSRFPCPDQPGELVTVGTGHWKIHGLTHKQWSRCFEVLRMMEVSDA